MFHSSIWFKYSACRSIYLMNCNSRKSFLKRKSLIISKQNSFCTRKAVLVWLDKQNLPSLLSTKSIKNLEVFKRNVSKTSVCLNTKKEPNDSDKNPPENNFNFLKFLMTWAVLWFIYSLLSRNSNQRRFEAAIISWEEFKNDILAKGEVDKLIYSLETQQVLVVLQKGAIIKNKHVC